MAADDAPPDEEAISVGEKVRSTIGNFWDLPAIESARRWRNSATGFSEAAGERVHRAATGPITGMYRALHQSPGAVIIILLLVSVFFGRYAIDFQHQINGDVEIYLPDGADSKELLLEVRAGWSTDIVMLYIHTDNAIEDETERGKCPEVDDCIYNVTSVHVLNQLSYLEGDETSIQGNYDRGLDWDKADRGRNDGIVWMRLDHLRQLTQRTEEVSWVTVKKNLGKLKDIEFQSPIDLMKDLITLLEHDRRNTKILWFILMFLAGISIFNTQVLNIFKRQKEIGVFIFMVSNLCSFK